jgi:hypothetical protein
VKSERLSLGLEWRHVLRELYRTEEVVTVVLTFIKFCPSRTSPV